MAEREAKSGKGAEPVEATAKPALTVTAPRSDPLRRPVIRAQPVGP